MAQLPTTDTGSSAQPAPTVTLVLGSGAARGLAHIGVIEELEQHGYAIRSIVGCSMGAVVGGFYAAGSLAGYKSWVCDLTRWDVLRFLDLSLTTRMGMMKGDLIMEKLRSLVGDQQIEDLPIPFTAIATDIVRRKEVWICTGDLFDAIRASMAIPGLFTPQRWQGRTLVDGGLLNPVPVAPATDDGTDLTIAVNLAGKPVVAPLGPVEPPPPQTEQNEEEEHRSRIESWLGTVQSALGLESKQTSNEDAEMSMSDVLIGMFDTMQASISRYRLAAYPPDLLIEIPENVCDPHDFHRAAELIAAGRYWTRQSLANQLTPDA
ncbi:MAG: patatin-like phospholipase family protein [Pseudomonadota bacterium]